ncbi:heme biosynthesis operon protein HemX [Pseudomethylobacillus aquaticus]|uniref:Heme biosynthesis operon protein HemX n=1 Tax=Pseudomethylobacillus aquaticus TaxID=2676064 RepID=A0A3N0V236_9PROT|nr:uroporphyrinogen-III C-methyltransferase [Pseudomethylobacillus aquaticus]ROH86867.1 heme biosynthesis operon protein HemX [Pseudomethylobacillus aquaticus]
MTQESTEIVASEVVVSASRPSISSSAGRFALILVVLALGLMAWMWWASNQRAQQLEQSLAVRLDDFNARTQETLTIAKLAEERSVTLAARAEMLEQRLAESRGQQEALQTLYYELANNREERIISEVEQLVIIASQQLHLASNVRSALLALQTAESRLQQLNTPQVIPLRKAVGQDIQRLQALPTVDTVGISLKLEGLADSADILPLVSERHPKATALATGPSLAGNTWQRLGAEIWHDLKQMIRLERVDRPEPPLLAPEQHFFLRENFKLRLLTARLALLQHDEATYRADLQAAEKWLAAYFDLREISTNNALTTLKQLSASTIVIDLPDINETLGLVSKYKLSLERSPGQEARS